MAAAIFQYDVFFPHFTSTRLMCVFVLAEFAPKNAMYSYYNAISIRHTVHTCCNIDIAFDSMDWSAFMCVCAHDIRLFVCLAMSELGVNNCVYVCVLPYFVTRWHHMLPCISHRHLATLFPFGLSRCRSSIFIQKMANLSIRLSNARFILTKRMPTNIDGHIETTPNTVGEVFRIFS